MRAPRHRPARPRHSAPRPSYPRRLGLGAAALLAAVAVSGAGCVNSVEVPDEGDDSGLTFQPPAPHMVLPEQGGSAGWEEMGGNFGGGAPEDWDDYPSAGGGGAGAQGSGAGGAG